MLRITSPIPVNEELFEVDDHTLSAKINGNYSSHHWFHYSKRGLLEIGLNSRNRSPEDITLLTWVRQQVKYDSPYTQDELDVLKINGLPCFNIEVNEEAPIYTDIDVDFTIWIEDKDNQLSILLGVKERLSVIFMGQRLSIGINTQGDIQLIQFTELTKDELDKVRYLVENKAMKSD